MGTLLHFPCKETTLEEKLPATENLYSHIAVVTLIGVNVALLANAFAPEILNYTATHPLNDFEGPFIAASPLLLEWYARRKQC